MEKRSTRVFALVLALIVAAQSAFSQGFDDIQSRPSSESTACFTDQAVVETLLFEPLVSILQSKLSAMWRKIIGSSTYALRPIAARRAGDYRRDNEEISTEIQRWHDQGLIRRDVTKTSAFWKPYLVNLLDSRRHGKFSESYVAFTQVADFLEQGRVGREHRIEIVGVALGSQRELFSASGEDGPLRVVSERVGRKLIRVYVPWALLQDAYYGEPYNGTQSVEPELVEEIAHEILQQSPASQLAAGISRVPMDVHQPEGPAAHWWVTASEIEAFTRVEAFGERLLPRHASELERAVERGDAAYLKKIIDTEYESDIPDDEKAYRQQVNPRAYEATVQYSYVLARAAEVALTRLSDHEKYSGSIDHFLAELKADPRRQKRLVVVVGGGPAGLTAANRLIKEGYRVAMIDRNKVLGGLGTFGIPAVDNQLGLKHTVLYFAKTLLHELGLAKKIEISGDLKSVISSSHRQIQKLVHLSDRLERSPDVTLFLEQNFNHLREFESLGIPVIIATGAQRKKTLGIPGETLGNVISATSEFFLKINILWVIGLLTRSWRHLLKLNYEGEPFEVGQVNVVYGGGNVASDAALAIHRLTQNSPGSNVKVVYRGPSWAMPNMAHTYHDKLGKHGVEIVGLTTVIAFLDKAGVGRITHAVYQQHQMAGVEFDPDEEPIAIIDGNKDSNKNNELLLPAGKTMADMGVPMIAFGPGGRRLSLTADQVSKKLNRFSATATGRRIAFRLKIEKVGQPYEERVNLFVEAIGNEVEPLQTLQIRHGMFIADEMTGRVGNRLVWIAGQALTQRGAIAGSRGSIKSAESAVKDLVKVMRDREKDSDDNEPGGSGAVGTGENSPKVSGTADGGASAIQKKSIISHLHLQWFFPLLSRWAEVLAAISMRLPLQQPVFALPGCA